MPLNFEWHEGEESPWTSPRGEGKKDGRAVWRARSLLIAGAISLALLASLATAYLSLERSRNEAEDDAQQQLLAISQLIRAADLQGDADLIENYLAEPGSAWAESKRELAARRLLFDRIPFDLFLLAPDLTTTAGRADPSPVPAAEVTTINADFTSAEISLQHGYRVGNSSQSDPIQLQQRLFFERTGGRWRLVPPGKEFWGETQEAIAGRVRLSFPFRDEATARRLAGDLNAAVDAACRSLADLDCPPDLTLAIQLETDPESLLHPIGEHQFDDAALTVKLPTPTLAGLPVDEEGYAALSRGYAGQVVSALLRYLAGWQCCQKGLFFQALVDKQLSKLGLRDWPLTPAENAAMLRNLVLPVTALHAAWRTGPADSRLSDPGWRQVYSLIDFLLHHRPDLSAAELQRSLLAHDDYWPWLTANDISIFGFEVQRQWLRFVQEQLPQDPTVALPAQDLLLLCTMGNRHEGSLYRYDLVADLLVPELAARDFQVMHPLPNDEGVFLQERTASDRFRALLWQEGQERPVLNQPTDAALSPLASWEARTAFHSFDRKQRRTIFGRLALENCDENGCPAVVLDGWPVWSPGGERSLLVTNDGWLWLGDDRGMPQFIIGAGSHPFWLNDETFGYLRTEGPAALVFFTVDGEIAGEPVALDALAAALPRQEADWPLAVQGVAVSAARAQTLFVVATAGRRPVVLTFDLASRQPALLTQLEDECEAFVPLRLSPNGRWLAIQELKSPCDSWQLHLYDVVSGQTQLLHSNLPNVSPGFDWSADGRWLVLVADGFVHLVAPAEEQQQLIVYDLPACPAAAWSARR